MVNTVLLWLARRAKAIADWLAARLEHRLRP